jgi:hypothetical protein
VLARGAMQSPQQAYGYSGQPCGGFAFGTDSVPYSNLSGLIYPFRDYLNSPVSQAPPVRGQYDSAPQNGIVSGRLYPALATEPVSTISSIVGRQNIAEFGTDRCNIGNGISPNYINFYNTQMTFQNLTPRRVVLEMTFPPFASLFRSADGSVVPFNVTPTRYTVDVSGATGSGCVQWRNRSGPLARQGQGFSYDSDRGVSVLFGGNWFDTTTVYLSDTWEWDGTTWRLAGEGAPAPAARWGHAQAYDAARHQTVLFGGFTGSAYSNQTWTWDGGSWTLASTTGPSVRRGSAIAFDAARGVVVLAGGYNGTSRLSDVWEWNGSSWTARNTTPRPSVRSDATMSYDSVRNVCVLFGGEGNSNAQLSDTWEWNGTSWTQRATTGPAARSRASSSFDPVRNVTVLTGGWNGTAVIGDTWEWNGTSWTQRSGNLFRQWGSAVYHAARTQILQFGGNDTGASAAQTDDLWRYSGSAGTWITRADAPSDRDFHAMAYDTVRTETVLFGGEDATGNRLSDTWTWDGDVWSRAGSLGPSIRGRHAMAFDSARGRVVLFGGYNGTASLGDTWEWAGSSWTVRSPATLPGVRNEHAMAYDAVRARTVMFGGTSLDTRTWLWNGTDWSIGATTGPAARIGPLMAYDSIRQRVVLFGGAPAAGGRFTDTWEWNGTSWTQIGVSGPAGRNIGAMVFDSARGVCVMMQGSATGNGFDSTVWEYNGASWTQVLPAPAPGRNANAAAFDSSRGMTVLFGGLSFTGALGDTWEYGRTLPPTITSNSGNVQGCHGHASTFSITTTGGSPRVYQWRKDGIPIAGAQSTSYTIPSVRAIHIGSYDCIVANSCGVEVSPVMALAMCIADFDNGSGSGQCDGGVGIEDLLYYLNIYDLGLIDADTDDGSGLGIADGGVGIEDLLYYLSRYDAGC